MRVHMARIGRYSEPLRLNRRRLRPLPLLALALLAPLGLQSAQAAEPMTKEKIVQYFDRFSKGDMRYTELLADDVEFPHVSGKVLRGKKEVVDYYQGVIRDGMREIREPTTIVIDNQNGIAAVELTFHITAAPGKESFTLPSTGQVVKQGEEWRSYSVMFYTFRDGKITGIRGALGGPSKLTLVK